MRLILAALLLFGGWSATAQTITYKQLTNFALLRTNPVVFGGTVGFDQSPIYLYNPGSLLVVYDGTNTYALFSLAATVLGTPNGPTALNGSFLLVNPPQTNASDLFVQGTAYDQNSVPFASQRYASNAVHVAAGAGTIVSSSGSGGVQTFTVTSTAGAGATNAISAVLTNAAIGGLGLTSIAFNDGFGNTVSGVSNNGAFTLTFKIDFSGPTNYVNSVGALLTNLCYIIGANATNFGYLIGANGTNFTLSTGQLLTNALGAKQDSYANLSQLGNSGITFPGTSQIESNVNQVFWNLVNTTVFTNSSSSNLVMNVRTNKQYIRITNNITITNFTGILEGQAWDTTWILEPKLINRGVAYPTFGAPSFGIYAATNVNAPLWTTLTNGYRYALTVSGFGTNTFWSLSEWR